ncbi:16S rRNA (cytidine(1402)-2'-O)-methyltransferase [Candidatus Pelagibacter bacterium]|nr:16S rRNA (cytidine(1402)-2'-O)-methyltransferase [Candidatus Pelagibacter bacterium]
MSLVPNSLYIVSTPIGNLDDITLRAINVLKNSDLILCEDTRRSLKLLNHLNIKKKLISFHKFNERKKTLIAIEYIKQGKILSLISDAGTPSISDPGRSLINECIKEKIEIIPIPGASSVLSAMSVSGFNDQFIFYGFLPKKENDLEKVLKSLSEINYSQVFFAPSNKLNLYIQNFKKYYSGRKLLIAKEITKLHEAFFRDSIDNFKLFKTSLKGEFTIVISEKDIKDKIFNEKNIAKKAKKYLKKLSVKDTVDIIFKSEKINKKKIYQLCLKIKNEKIS